MEGDGGSSFAGGGDGEAALAPARGAAAGPAPPAPDETAAPGPSLPAALRPPRLAATAAGRLGELCARWGLSRRQRDQLAILLDILQRDPKAPTSVRAAHRAVEVHLADSLAALEVEQIRTARRVADVGSGAGLPGLPLAIALPEARFHLVESATRKCRFLDGVLAATAIDNAEPVCARVEQWEEGRGAHDVVTARAVAPAPVVVEYAAPLLALGGTLVDWRGAVSPEEEARALAAAAILGLRRDDVIHTSPFPEARQHFLHLYVKVRDTPSRFPRRPGMARKRPLPA